MVTVVHGGGAYYWPDSERAVAAGGPLKKTVVPVIHLREFKPSGTNEKGDVDAVVIEFRAFLERALGGDGAGQHTMGKIFDSRRSIELDTAWVAEELP
jgi:hypothetical protein